MYESVIFDFDGTLVDSDPIIDQLMEFFAERYALHHMNRTRFNALKTLPLREKIREAGLPLYKLPRLVQEVRREYASHIDLLEMMPGMERLLCHLADHPVRLFILSSNATNNIRTFLGQQHLEFFVDIQSAPDIMRKEKGIRKLLQRHHIRAQSALYIGDELRDIQACQKIPMDIAAVTWGHDSADLLGSGQPTYLVEEPESLLDLILHPGP